MTASMMSGVVFFVQYLQASLGEGPLTAGPAAPADRDAFRRRPDRGAAGRPPGRAPDRRGGPAVPGGGPGLDGVATGGSYPALIPAMVLTGSGFRRDAGRAKRRHRGGAPGGDRHRLRRLQRDAAGRRRLGIAIASAVFAAAGGFASPAAVSHGVRAALLVTAAIAAPAR